VNLLHQLARGGGCLRIDRFSHAIGPVDVAPVPLHPVHWFDRFAGASSVFSGCSKCSQCIELSCFPGIAGFFQFASPQSFSKQSGNTYGRVQVSVFSTSGLQGPNRAAEQSAQTTGKTGSRHTAGYRKVNGSIGYDAAPPEQPPGTTDPAPGAAGPEP